MADLIQFDLEKTCKAFFHQFEELLIWEWDDRFHMVLAILSVKDQQKICAVIEQHFVMTWNNANIGQAPGRVQAIKQNMGGLMATQLLFTSDPDQEDFIYCAWWPWMDGENVSIRLAIENKTLQEDGKEQYLNDFKGWFGV